MGWLIPHQDEAWWEVTIGEPSEALLVCRDSVYLSTAPFVSQDDAEAFIRWCIVDGHEPIATTRRSPPDSWSKLPRSWSGPKTAPWEVFVERGTIKGRWWWLLLATDDQPTALAGTFASRDEALGFLGWLREDGPMLNVERYEPIEYSFEERRTWLTEIEQEVDRKRRGQRIDFDEALAEVERPKRAKPDLFELMRRHEAKNRSVKVDLAGGNGA